MPLVGSSLPVVVGHRHVMRLESLSDLVGCFWESPQSPAVGRSRVSARRSVSREFRRPSHGYLLWLLEVERERAAAGLHSRRSPSRPDLSDIFWCMSAVKRQGTVRPMPCGDSATRPLALRKTDADLDRDKNDCSDAATPRRAPFLRHLRSIASETQKPHAVRYSRHHRRHVERM